MRTVTASLFCYVTRAMLPLH